MINNYFTITLFHKSSFCWCYLRAAACKDREFAVNDKFGESLIFGPKLPFGELFSKIIFKSSTDVFILRDSQKLENAVKVRFFGQLKIQNKVRERSIAKYCLLFSHSRKYEYMCLFSDTFCICHNNLPQKGGSKLRIF